MIYGNNQFLTTGSRKKPPWPQSPQICFFKNGLALSEVLLPEVVFETHVEPKEPVNQRGEFC